MLGQIYKYGSIVAILARFAFKFELESLNFQDHHVFVKRMCGVIWGKIFFFGLSPYPTLPKYHSVENITLNLQSYFEILI